MPLPGSATPAIGVAGAATGDRPWGGVNAVPKVADGHDGSAAGLARHVARIPKLIGLRLREQFADGDAPHFLGLQDLEAGRLDRKVVGVRVVDQLGQDRVVEDVPPGAQVGVAMTHLGIGGVNPGVRQRRRRPFVVGADLETVVDILRDGGATTQTQNGRRQAKPRSQAPRGRRQAFLCFDIVTSLFRMPVPTRQTESGRAVNPP